MLVWIRGCLPKSLIHKAFLNKSTISVDISVGNVRKAHANACQHWLRGWLRSLRAPPGVLQIKHLAQFRGNELVQKHCAYVAAPLLPTWG
jgi:hypothetical protein